MFSFVSQYRVRKAKSENAKVIDVDGTYLEKKRQRLLAANVQVALLPPPAFPPHGWQIVDEEKATQVAGRMPCVLPTTLYTYLAKGVGNTKFLRHLEHSQEGMFTGHLGAYASLKFILFIRCMLLSGAQ